MLLGWREAFPWISGLMLPTLVFFIWRDGSIAHGAQFWVLTTAFTLASGPIQILFAYRLGVPEIRRHRLWFAQYLLYTVLFYQEAKNMVIRVAQIRQLIGIDEWVVTPRGAAGHPVRTGNAHR